ncbi:MAG: DUF2339 domain-containing protein [Actinobacteria bacterium]|nr:MAG: DUF2339 domain-containing protein [Actinomycetota bacterium]
MDARAPFRSRRRGRAARELVRNRVRSCADGRGGGASRPATRRVAILDRRWCRGGRLDPDHTRVLHAAFARVPGLRKSGRATLGARRVHPRAPPRRAHSARSRVSAQARASGASIDTDFQRGHTAVSGLWAVVGLGLLVIGLVRGSAVIRYSGLALFGLTLAKIFLYDLAALSSIARAFSFILVGALLLAGGFFLQRLSDRIGPRSP